MFPIGQQALRISHLLYLLLFSVPLTSHATLVEMQTNLGNIDIELFDTLTPITVANFLTYVNSGAYNKTIIHRSVPGFVVQGGGYTYDYTNHVQVAINTLPPIKNEFGQSNQRGTIAMAKLSNSPNSATSQWFFNLADNTVSPYFLDSQNGGFTVFGKVINGMGVVDSIAALPTTSSSIPLFAKGYLIEIYDIIVKKTLADQQFKQLIALTTTFTTPSRGTILGITFTNSQDIPVAVTLVKNHKNVLQVIIPANASLTTPFQSGLPFTSSDSLQILLPSNFNLSGKPVYLSFDLK